MTIFEGNYSPKDLRIGIVVARFNEFINQKLLQGALDNLKRHGVKEEQIDIYWVPGAFEIPFITKKLSKKGQLRWVDYVGDSYQRCNYSL